MARLKAHGTELARREMPDSRIAVMSDGNIMRNYGQGWKLWKKLKAGVDPAEYARKFEAKTAAIPSQIKTYIDTLINACDLEHRSRLHLAISLMPQDPDGVWSEMNDFSYGYSIDLDDIQKCCLCYQIYLDLIKSEKQEAVA